MTEVVYTYSDWYCPDYCDWYITGKLFSGIRREKSGMAECESIFGQDGCLHGCVHDLGHKEKHVCGCGYEWTDDEAEDE